MKTQKEKLIDILSVPIHPRIGVAYTEVVADYLLDNDVFPVVHGHWIECSNELNKKCSECDKVNGTIYKHENYCPNCGAKMLGGE